MDNFLSLLMHNNVKILIVFNMKYLIKWYVVKYKTISNKERKRKGCDVWQSMVFLSIYIYVNQEAMAGFHAVWSSDSVCEMSNAGALGAWCWNSHYPTFWARLNLSIVSWAWHNLQPVFYWPIRAELNIKQHCGTAN